MKSSCVELNNNYLIITPGENPPSSSFEFKDRTFLMRKSERQILRQFVLEEITIADFLQSAVTSENGLLIKAVIARLARTHNYCPDEYKDLLSDLCRQSAVSGLIQVNSREPLRILRVMKYFIKQALQSSCELLRKLGNT